MSLQMRNIELIVTRKIVVRENENKSRIYLHMFDCIAVVVYKFQIVEMDLGKILTKWEYDDNN